MGFRETQPNIVKHTVVIPTKDRPNLLRRAVGSALAGLAQGGEVLVIDDHSQTEAKKTLRQVHDPRLRILCVPAGQTGVSAARNFGIAQARGDVIFFLDDDDTLQPGYCAHVLREGAMGHDYGFSSVFQATCKQGKPRLKTARFAQGTIPSAAGLGRKLCGFGMGFWIWRHVVFQMGPIRQDLSINEDTEYLCRLISKGRKGWYSELPGVVVWDHSGGTPGDLGHLTRRASAAERARCMSILCETYPTMASYLGRGYLRHCLKAGTYQQMRQFIVGLQSWRMRAAMLRFALVKGVAYSATGRLGRLAA
ncbi:glycosyltransferase family A protein [Yoonia sp. BS5-3]|uniref:Glycosyltransferase family A protein n=1 Tax=Yoonia phaeophyticola TaxID=3137369 RepID=A0ABZ2V2J1_9RHOB